jgi:ABC-type polysaccharide/polyol phosphate transport system ATPase subunit
MKRLSKMNTEDIMKFISGHKAELNLIKGGVTTVYVSHSMEAIKKICDKAIWLEIRAEGEAGQVVEEYLKAQSQV